VTELVDLLRRSAHDATFGTIGVAIAAALLIALRFLLPQGSRHKIRIPFALLIAHLAIVALRLAVDPSALRGISAFLLLLSIGRSAFILVIETFLGERAKKPLPKIFRDILQGVVYAGVALIALRVAGVEPGSLLTTSALLTAVVGLSLQDTLGNLFAGLSIQAQNPFEVGDWIQFDEEPRHIGQVTEINWRATKILTLNLVEVIVPNGTLAKAPIRNFTKPSPMARCSVDVMCSYDAPPHEVIRVLDAAVRDVKDVLLDPAPMVLNAGLDDSGITYKVNYFIDAFRRRDVIESEIRNRIWYALRRANISIPYPMRTLHVHEISDDTRARAAEEQRARRIRTLRGVDFLDVLPESVLATLADLTEARLYAEGEVIIRQGDEGDEFFIIQSGEVSVAMGRAGGSVVEVARLGPGKFFGEMSLMTGEQRKATVRALKSCELIVVRKNAFQTILQATPELAERISEVLVGRMKQNEESMTSRKNRSIHEADPRGGILLERIKDFFALGGRGGSA